MNYLNAFFDIKKEPELSENGRAYLVHSYLYYELNSSVISDTEFDSLCKNLLDEKPNHPLISIENLQAGTGYSIKDYPQDIIDEANKLLAEYIQKELDYEMEKDEIFDVTWVDTYLLCGLYIDFGYAKIREKQDICQKELEKRWNEGKDKDIFYKYFENHNEKPEKFKLTNS